MNVRAPGGLVLLLVLAALLPSSLAMTCDSNTEATKCNSAVDGNVKCVWDVTKGTCGSGDQRTETGMVGITSVEVENPNPMDDMPILTLTPEEVQKAVDALSLNSTFCTLPPDNTTSTGIACAAYFEMWTYNATSGRCEEYVYGGCSGTDNLFESEAVCAKAAEIYCTPGVATAAADSPKESTTTATGPSTTAATPTTTPVTPGDGAMGVGVGLMISAVVALVS